MVIRDQAEAARRTMESLRGAAETGEIEVVVVDLASRDGSAALDQTFPFVRMLRMPKNFGSTRAWNIATRTAVGEYLCFCQAGTVWEATSLPALRAALDADSEALAVAPATVNAAGESVMRRLPRLSAAEFSRFWQRGELPAAAAAGDNFEYLVGAPILIRKRSVAGMNYLDERYGEFWWDAELCLQIRRANKRLKIVPDVVVRGDGWQQPFTGAIDRRSAELSADAANGAAQFLGKHAGFAAGLQFRVGALLGALASVLTLAQAGPKLRRLLMIASGQRIDGNQ